MRQKSVQPFNLLLAGKQAECWWVDGRVVFFFLVYFDLNVYS